MNRLSREGRTTFETILVTIFVGVLILVAIDRFLTSIQYVRENALRIELLNIRKAIGFYKMTKGKYPESLKALIEEQIVLPGDVEPIILKAPYLQAMTIDKEGYLLDPFGNRFIYDSETGRVKSGTKGYEMW